MIDYYLYLFSLAPLHAAFPVGACAASLPAIHRAGLAFLGAENVFAIRLFICGYA